MIVGMTHDENGDINKVTKYRGKISTGYEPNESPNTTNHPVACGFFRLKKEIIKSQRVGREQKIVATKEWVMNEPIQKKLEVLNNNSQQPRSIEIVSLFKNVNEMWESCLAKFSQSDGLTCKSHGLGTEAKQLIKGATERSWSIRNPGIGCKFHECEDYKKGDCKQLGLFKCFPVIDLAPNPYRFETRSINTIIGIESAFEDLTKLLQAAHIVKQIEANTALPYDGLFGSKFFLKHRKVKSGGRDVFITDLTPTPEFIESVMEPIKRGLASKAKQSRMIGAAGAVSLLSDVGDKFLEASKISVDEPAEIDGSIPLSLDDQRDIATNFSSGNDDGDGVYSDELTPVDAVNIIPEDLSKKAVDALMNDGVQKSD